MFDQFLLVHPIIVMQYLFPFGLVHLCWLSFDSEQTVDLAMDHSLRVIGELMEVYAFTPFPYFAILNALVLFLIAGYFGKACGLLRKLF